MYKLKNEISKAEVEIIFTLAECGLNPSRAARKLNIHRNTVIYHIGEIEDFTGLNPLDFYDLQKLLERVKADDEL
ncbi:MAG: helix-turn-helix domain-containing protein [Clostridia bacterium]|nr:helix-turn-helix domain-containing protein [Clostridia bacterium]